MKIVIVGASGTMVPPSRPAAQDHQVIRVGHSRGRQGRHAGQGLHRGAVRPDGPFDALVVASGASPSTP